MLECVVLSCLGLMMMVIVVLLVFVGCSVVVECSVVCVILVFELSMMVMVSGG